MHVPFNPEQIDWIIYLKPCESQIGFGNVFSGIPYQRGAGIGSVFRSFLRFLLPLGKQAGAAIARQGLESGSRILTDMLDGEDLKKSLHTEGRKGISNLLVKAADTLKNDIPKQKGEGIAKYKTAHTPIKRKGKVLNSHKNLYATVGPQISPTKKSRRQRKDFLGNY